MSRHHRLGRVLPIGSILALAVSISGCSLLPGLQMEGEQVSLFQHQPAAAYPNINIIPPPPSGSLMTYAEEQRTKSWLQRLGARQRAAAPRVTAAQSAASAAALLHIAATHGADALAIIETMCRSETGRPEDTVNCPQ
jgi:hypothetical protein